MTAPVETSKLVLTTYYGVSITSRLASRDVINCYILFKYFRLIFLRLQLVKISCKLIII